MQSESSSNGIARNLGLLSTKQWLPGTEYLEQRHYASTTINLRLEQIQFLLGHVSVRQLNAT
jgi:hypothetical protein